DHEPSDRIRHVLLGLAADVPDRALRGYRFGVGKRYQDPNRARDRLLVQPREAATHHPGGGPVAEPAGAAEAEAGRAAVAGRVERCERERRPREVVAGPALERGVPAAPVR